MSKENYKKEIQEVFRNQRKLDSVYDLVEKVEKSYYDSIKKLQKINKELELSEKATSSI